MSDLNRLKEDLLKFIDQKACIEIQTIKDVYEVNSKETLLSIEGDVVSFNYRGSDVSINLNHVVSAIAVDKSVESLLNCLGSKPGPYGSMRDKLKDF